MVLTRAGAPRLWSSMLILCGCIRCNSRAWTVPQGTVVGETHEQAGCVCDRAPRFVLCRIRSRYNQGRVALIRR
ncbi:hypothetical protein B0J12DRAFT_678907 [Macrophomina phaseolina]|uniref:Secreted protein n=1 Tax=Macrophomina phaseolina TaxID=35725 RepID=A0ABQ8FYR6_9PEZI|nr:hypothetical protein B0J12DRAFT_678907 [Macrophomina phaseolina]